MKLHAVMQLCAQTEYYASLPITSDHSQCRDNALSSASTYVIRSLPSYGSMKERHAAYRKRALRMPIDVYSRLLSHVYRLRSHAKLFTLACVSYAYPLIVACVSIHLSLSGCLSVLYVNYSTCRRQLENGGWHLAQLAIEEARAREHKRQIGQMRKCERNLIGNRGSANEPPHHRRLDSKRSTCVLTEH